MYGPYTSLEALNEAISGKFEQLQVGDKFTYSRWPEFDTIEIDKRFKDHDSNTFRYNLPLEILYQTVLTNPDYALKVYVQVYPAGESPKELGDLFHTALDREKLVEYVTAVTSRGYPPSFVRVSLVGGFTYTEIDNLVQGAWNLYEKKQAGEDVSAQIRNLKAYADLIWKKDQHVLAWIQRRVRKVTFPGHYRATKFTLNADGEAPPADIMIGGHPLFVTNAEEKFLAQTHSRAEQAKLTKIVWRKYVEHAWRLFSHFVKNAHEGPEQVLSRALSDVHAVGAPYDASKGIPVKTVTEPPAGQHPPKAEHKSEGFRGKVVGSIQDTNARFDVVTADPGYRQWVQADGTIKKPEKESVDQRDLAFVPAGPVDPLIDKDQYKVIFGIHYDNPMLDLRKNEQTYWYSNRNHFLSAAQLYSKLTGDRPTIAYIIYEKSGPRAGLSISARELQNKGGHEGLKIKQEIDSLIQAFWHHADRGQQLFPAVISANLGISSEKFIVPNNPFRDTPEEVDQEVWDTYRKWVRRQASLGLGLNFSAGLSSADRATLANLRYHRHQILARNTVNRTKKFAGERDADGNPVEKWGVYLIEYALGYRGSDYSGDETFMVPLNVIRSNKGDLDPRKTLTKVTEQDLRKLLETHWHDITFMTPRNRQGQPMLNAEWKYERADPSLAFPYARLIRPIVVSNHELLASVNNRLPSSVRRTTHGIKIDGVEFDVYLMVTAMPPSVVEKVFKLLYRNGSSRQLISDPGMLTRLITSQLKHLGGERGKHGVDRVVGSPVDLGLTSRPLGVRFPENPYAKASQTTPDPFTRLGWTPGTSTPLEPEYLLSELGERWRPIVQATLTQVGNVAERYASAFERNHDPEARKAMVERWQDEIQVQTQQTLLNLQRYLQDTVKTLHAQGRTLSSEMTRHIQQYLEYVKRPLPEGGSYTVPELTNKVTLRKFQAVIGDTEYRNNIMSIKAPSEDIAKLTILYRLLRRSAKNKEIGKAMLAKGRWSGQKIIPITNMMILAQWSKNNFIVMADEGPHTRSLWGRPKIYPKEVRFKRAEPMGDHRYARMLGFSDIGNDENR